MAPSTKQDADAKESRKNDTVAQERVWRDHILPVARVREQQQDKQMHRAEKPATPTRGAPYPE